MGSSTQQHHCELCVFVQLYKRCSKAADTGNVDYRQVQLEQGFALCIALLEALQPQSLAMPDLSDCEQSSSACCFERTNIPRHAMTKNKCPNSLKRLFVA